MECQIIFRSPIHANGGCIFANPVELLVVTDFGGKQFLSFRKITEPLEKEMQIDSNLLTYIGGSENEVEVDGKTYKIVAHRSPTEIINEAENLDEILAEAVDKLGITKRKARKMLFNEVIEGLKKVEKVKESVFNDDEEIIMILVAVDDI